MWNPCRAIRRYRAKTCAATASRRSYLWPRATVENGGYLEEIGAENLFESKSDAIAGVFDRLDKDICARCEQRIFIECASAPRADQT